MLVRCVACVWFVEHRWCWAGGTRASTPRRRPSGQYATASGCQGLGDSHTLLLEAKLQGGLDLELMVLTLDTLVQVHVRLDAAVRAGHAEGTGPAPGAL